MNGPLINILIRTTTGREQEFKRCISSIRAQMYSPLRLIICTDSPTVSPYITQSLNGFRETTILYIKNSGVPYHWNFYCNNLKDKVNHGWFFYLDDDDYLVSENCLSNIAKHLFNPSEGVICQFNRGRRAKPDPHEGDVGINIHLPSINWYINKDTITRGKIGGSCIFLHHTKKDIANWDGQRAADYRFIKSVADKIPLKFVPVIVVQAGNKGRHGK